MNDNEIKPKAIDPYTALARASFEAFVRTGAHIAIPEGLPEALLTQRAGVFVSLHENDELRGCIGTLEPCQSCIAEEIIRNAVLACSEDPRFPAVRADELPHIVCNVDVLTPPEPIPDPGMLDVKRYGVIVSRGWKRGVLLPDLEGVDSVDMQIAIAKRKAGIAAADPCDLLRFEVVRHTE